MAKEPKSGYFYYMKKTVYIETTIPSYYYEKRKTHQAITWKDATRKWWKEHRKHYQVVTSEFVFIELGRGRHPNQKEKIALIKGIERLGLLPIIKQIADVYIENRLMPKEYAGDAFHLAHASYYGIDFLLTWNCSNLANPNKYEHLHIINKSMDLKSPVLCTPEQLLMGGKG